MIKELTLRKLIELAQSINIENEDILDLPLIVRVSEGSIFALRPSNFEGIHTKTVFDTKLIMDFVGVV